MYLMLHDALVAFAPSTGMFQLDAAVLLPVIICTSLRVRVESIRKIMALICNL